MPRTDPKSSFEVAVRHLFRHLNDAAALRGNPIVSRFFPTGERCRDPERVANAMDMIRRLVAEGAERAIHCDSARGWAERRLRHLAIVKRCVLQREDPDAVRADLGISVRQFYRDRVEICTQIARYIESHPVIDGGVTRCVDVRRFQLDRAHAQAEAGDYEEALQGYSDLGRSASAPADRVEMLCCRAGLEVEQGEFASARATLDEANRALGTVAEDVAAVTAVGCKARVALFESKLAWATGAFPMAAGCLDRARTILASNCREAPAQTLMADVLIELLNRAVEIGSFEAATRYDGELERLRAGSPPFSPEHEADQILVRSTLSFCTVHAGSPFSRAQQDYELNRALDLARTRRSFKRIIILEASLLRPLEPQSDSTIGIIDAARRIIAMARDLKNRGVLVRTAIDLAGVIVFTKAWRSVPALLADAESRLNEPSLNWAHMQVLKSTYHLKAGQAAEAWACAERAYDVGRAMEGPRVIAASLRALGSAAFAMRRRDEALDYIVAALALSEQSPPWARSQGYHVAGLITGQAKYERAAAELRRVITAG